MLSFMEIQSYQDQPGFNEYLPWSGIGCLKREQEIFRQFANYTISLNIIQLICLIVVLLYIYCCAKTPTSIDESMKAYSFLNR